MRSVVVLLLLVMMLGACANPVPPPATPAAAMRSAPSAEGFTKVSVFFATNRNQTKSKEANDQFGSDRSEILYGISDVSIPRGHTTGSLESPSIFQNENPKEHVVLMRSVVLSKGKFYADLSAEISKSVGRNALLFVHGYNVTFRDAARRTAQMSFDLKFDGAPMFFSWPSQGLGISYIRDEAQIEWAETDVKQVLNDLLELADAENVYIVAHSMGNRAVTRAIGSLLMEKPNLRSKVKEIILAAPDIDADVFKRAIAPALLAAGRPVTLYASSDDMALEASRMVHGWPRLGMAGSSLVVMRGIETVDATGVDTSFLAHSYYGSTPSVISDLCRIIHDGARAGSRDTVRRASSSSSVYWTFTGKTECISGPADGERDAAQDRRRGEQQPRRDRLGE